MSIAATVIDGGLPYTGLDKNETSSPSPVKPLQFPTIANIEKNGINIQRKHGMAVIRNFRKGIKMIQISPVVCKASCLVLALATIFLVNHSANAESFTINQSQHGLIWELKPGEIVGQSFIPTFSGYIDQIGISSNGMDAKLTIHEGSGETGKKIYSENNFRLNNSWHKPAMHKLTRHVQVEQGKVYTFIIKNLYTDMRGLESSYFDAYPYGKRLIYKKNVKTPDPDKKDLLFSITGQGTEDPKKTAAMKSQFAKMADIAKKQSDIAKKKAELEALNKKKVEQVANLKKAADAKALNELSLKYNEAMVTYTKCLKKNNNKVCANELKKAESYLAQLKKLKK